MLGITVVISFLLSIFLSSSFSYDAASKWDIYATALPLSVKKIVGEKYVLVLISMLVSFLVACISFTIVFLIFP